MSTQHAAVQKLGPSSWGLEQYMFMEELRRNDVPWQTITSRVMKAFTPKMKAVSVRPSFYLLRKKMLQERKIDAETLLPPTQPSTSSEPTAAAQPAAEQQSAVQQQSAAESSARAQPTAQQQSAFQQQSALQQPQATQQQPATDQQPAADHQPAANRQPAAAHDPAAVHQLAAPLTQDWYASAMWRVGGELQAMQQRYNGVVQERNSLLQERNSLRDELIEFYGVWQQEREENLCEQFEETGRCTLRHCCKMHQWDKRRVHFEDEDRE